MKKTKILFILLCIAAIVIFWNLKDKKLVLAPQIGKLSATIKPLTKEELNSEALGLQESFVRVAERLKPAVVNISAVQTIKYEVPQQRYEFFFGDPFEDFFREFGEQYGKRPQPKKEYKKYRAGGTGTGVIIDEEGYVLTNEHVVHNADEINVTVNINGEEKKYKGKIIGKDSRTDLAIIKISSNKKFPAAPLGDSDKIRVGEWVITIGSPFGLEQTVTSGIVSALRQSIVVEGRGYRDFIQTDAAINRGNSGGPLCNIRGEVIGINTAIFAPTGVFSGIGFAIPINSAKEVLDDLIHKGKVIRGWLGIEIKPVDGAIVKQFGLPDKNGALINNVLKDSPASKAGLKRGDVIREFDGQQVNSVSGLQSVVSKTQPNKKVKVKIIRDGKEQGIELVTGEMPEQVTGGEIEETEKETGKNVSSFMGMKVSNLNDRLQGRYGIPGEEKGVVVVELEQGSKAHEMGFSEGDLIKSINREDVINVDAFEKVTKKVKLSEGVVFDIIRAGRPVYLSYVE